MKKKRLILLTLTILILVSACSKKEKKKAEIESEESFYGMVKEVNEENILVERYDEEGNPEEGNLLYVSLDLQLEESDTDFTLGDEVTVYYNGVVARSYPGQVNMVYAIIIGKSAESIE